MAHELPELPYAKDALEPHISAETLEFHHDKHHAAYVNNLNNALDGHPDLAGKTIEHEGKPHEVEPLGAEAREAAVDLPANVAPRITWRCLNVTGIISAATPTAGSDPPARPAAHGAAPAHAPSSSHTHSASTHMNTSLSSVPHSEISSATCAPLSATSATGKIAES